MNMSYRAYTEIFDASVRELQHKTDYCSRPMCNNVHGVS